ncbi:MAG: hypothetical protein CVU65_13805 [Deltaproteobacteria bacterium HGW-Deltaproteobacteria-22]|nr:MAG: hypothetical protein CVU65_13805 [Deltaproteobacteria bacterium HGW-Deltaproteobacteria-22]
MLSDLLRDEDDRARFVPLPPPTDEDITHLTAIIAARLTKRLRETIVKAHESDAHRIVSHARKPQFLAIPVP